jgi:uncharacterized protein (DUF1697 family)
MVELRELATEFGLCAPRTYIQSGNLVFGSERTEPDLSAALEAAVKDRFGRQPFRRAGQRGKAAAFLFLRRPG